MNTSEGPLSGLRSDEDGRIFFFKKNLLSVTIASVRSCSVELFEVIRILVHFGSLGRYIGGPL